MFIDSFSCLFLVNFSVIIFFMSMLLLSSYFIVSLCCYVLILHVHHSWFHSIICLLLWLIVHLWDGYFEFFVRNFLSLFFRAIYWRLFYSFEWAMFSHLCVRVLRDLLMALGKKTAVFLSLFRLVSYKERPSPVSSSRASGTLSDFSESKCSLELYMEFPSGRCLCSQDPIIFCSHYLW